MEGMELSFHGFSIRRYTSEMRSKDVSKCWLFSSKETDHLSQDVVQDFLPEITVKNFRWWAHELQALGSNSNHASSSTQPLPNQQTAPELLADGNTQLEGTKSVAANHACGVFTAATGTAVNAHNSCLVQVMKNERRQLRMNSTGKLKSPKKRSIAEIFAVAPQIETVESIDEDDDDEVDETLHCGKRGSIDHVVTTKTKCTPNIRAKKKSTVRKKMRRTKKKTKLEKSANLMKIKRRKKKFLKKGLSAKKENEDKQKLQKPICCARKLIGRCHSTRPLVDATDGMSDCSQKLELKPVAKGKKRKVQKPEPVVKQKKRVFPRGILKKKHPKSTSEKMLATCNNKDGVRETYCGDAEVLASNRHVKFSGNDDILGSGLRNSTSGKHLLDFFSDVIAVTQTKENSSGNVEKEKANVEEANCCSSVSTKTNKRVEVQPVFENEQFSNTSEHITKLTLLKPHLNHEKSMHLTLNSGPENHASSVNNNTHVDKGKMTVMHSPPYAGFPQLSLASQSGQDLSTNSRCADVPGSLYSGANLSDYIVDSTNAMIGMNSRTKGKPPYMQPPAAFSVMKEKRRHMLQSFAEDDDCHAPWRCQLPQLCPFGKLYDFCPSLDRMNGSAAFRQGCRNERSFCLPLNSDGELIRSSSSETLAYLHGNSSTLSSPSSSGLPVNLVLPSHQGKFRTRETDLTEIALNRCRVNPFPNYPARLGVTELQVNERATVHSPRFKRRWNGHDCAIDIGRSITKNSFDEDQNNQVANQHGNSMIHLTERFPPVSTSQPTMRLMGKDVTICSSEDLQRPVGESRRMVSCRDTALASSSFKRPSQKDRSFSLSPMMPTEPMFQAPHAIVNGREGTQSMLLSYGPETKFTHFLLNPRANAVCQRGRFPSGRNYQHHLAESPGFYPVLDRESDLTLPLMSGSQHRELRPQLQVPPTPNSTGQHTYMSSVDLIHKNLHLSKSAYDFSLSHRNQGAPSSGTAPSFLNRTQQKCPPLTSQYLTSIASPCFTTLPGVDTNVPTTMCREKPMDRMLDFGAIKGHDPFPGCRKRPATHIDGSARTTEILNLSMPEFSNLTVLALESSRAIGPNQGGVDANGRVGLPDETQNFRSKVHAGFDSWSPYGMVRSSPTKLT